MKPVVSLCMPHLNSHPFTGERIDSILRQDLRDWELIIVDSGSDDGSRGILERHAAADPRIRLVQAPRDGIYPGLNRALELAAAPYVYVATSDDTMRPDCLSRMVAALEDNPDCGLAHCNLEIIDEHGRPVDPADRWETFPAQRYFGDLLHRPHVRRAPHDGLLHFGFFTVYTSLTQLLIRRRVLQERGLFRADCSSHADFEWGLRVGLQENVVHVPAPLATWRRHGAQATRPDALLRARASGIYRRLVRLALDTLRSSRPDLARALADSSLQRYYLVDELKARRQLGGSIGGLGGFAVRHPAFLAHWLARKTIGGGRIVAGFDADVRLEAAKLGFTRLLLPLE